MPWGWILGRLGGVGAHLIELRDGLRRKLGNFPVELVFEASTGIHEADFFAVFGLVDGSKILETQLASLAFRFPDGGGGSIATVARRRFCYLRWWVKEVPSSSSSLKHVCFQIADRSSRWQEM